MWQLSRATLRTPSSSLAPSSRSTLLPRVAELIEYPHGCARQTTSKALAQLYLDDFTDLTKEQKATIEANVKSALNKLYKHVVSDGGIGYWAGDSFSNYWCSAYVYIFFSEAENAAISSGRASRSRLPIICLRT